MQNHSEFISCLYICRIYAEKMIYSHRFKFCDFKYFFSLISYKSWRGNAYLIYIYAVFNSLHTFISRNYKHIRKRFWIFCLTGISALYSYFSISDFRFLNCRNFRWILRNRIMRSIFFYNFFFHFLNSFTS